MAPAKKDWALLLLALVAGLGGAWMARAAPGRLRSWVVGLGWGSLALALVAAVGCWGFLVLARRHQRARDFDGPAVVRHQGRAFAAFFALHNLLWAGGLLLLAAFVLGGLGSLWFSRWMVGVLVGLAWVALLGLARPVPLALLGLCWRVLPRSPGLDRRRVLAGAPLRRIWSLRGRFEEACARDREHSAGGQRILVGLQTALGAPGASPPPPVSLAGVWGRELGHRGLALAPVMVAFALVVGLVALLGGLVSLLPGGGGWGPMAETQLARADEARDTETEPSPTSTVDDPEDNPVGDPVEDPMEDRETEPRQDEQGEQLAEDPRGVDEGPREDAMPEGRRSPSDDHASEGADGTEGTDGPGGTSPDGQQQGDPQGSNGQQQGDPQGSNGQEQGDPQGSGGQEQGDPQGSNGQEQGDPQGSGGQEQGDPQGSGGQEQGDPQGSGGQQQGDPQGSGGQQQGDPQGPGGQEQGDPQGSGGQQQGDPQGSGGQQQGDPQGSGGQRQGDPQGSGGQQSSGETRDEGGQTPGSGARPSNGRQDEGGGGGRGTSREGAPRGSQSPPEMGGGAPATTRGPQGPVHRIVLRGEGEASAAEGTPSLEPTTDQAIEATGPGPRASIESHDSTLRQPLPGWVVELLDRLEKEKR